MMYQSLMALRRVGLFQGLTSVQITEIFRRSESVVLRAGDTIISKGSTSDAAFVIVSGTAERVTGPELAGGTQPVPPGSLVGEMAMFVETEHSSTVVAAGPVRALKITRAALLAQMGEDQQLAEHFVAAFAGQLRLLANILRRVERAMASEGDDDVSSGGVYYLPSAPPAAADRPGLARHH